MDASSDPDHADVLALQAGDDSALSRIMERHRDGVFGFIRRMTGHDADAEELAQETFVRVYFQIDKYRPRSVFAAWLYRIARNLCLDYFRSRAWKEGACNESLASGGMEAGMDPAPRDTEILERLKAAVESLPVRLREPLVLTALEGHSHAEAARRLGISSKAVEAKCHRARAALRKTLEKS